MGQGFVAPTGTSKVAQYPKIQRISSVGSVVMGILGVQVGFNLVSPGDVGQAEFNYS